MNSSQSLARISKSVRISIKELYHQPFLNVSDRKTTSHQPATKNSSFCTTFPVTADLKVVILRNKQFDDAPRPNEIQVSVKLSSSPTTDKNRTTPEPFLFGKQRCGWTVCRADEQINKSVISLPPPERSFNSARARKKYAVQ